MARVRSIRADPLDPFNWRPIVIPLVTAISQTGVVAFKWTPGYRFQVARVRSYNLAKAGAVSGNVKVAANVAAAIVFTSATEVAQSLSGTLSNLRGLNTDTLSLEYTTDGSGVLTNGLVIVEIRPFPMAGEVAVGP